MRKHIDQSQKLSYVATETLSINLERKKSQQRIHFIYFPKLHDNSSAQVGPGFF
jgi:hypothetical protein